MWSFGYNVPNRDKAEDKMKLSARNQIKGRVIEVRKPTRYREILERLKANGVTINAGPLLVIPPAIHSFYFFDPNGIRLEISSDLDGDEEDLQVIRSCSMSETELRAELETISSDRAWIDEMVAAMTLDEIGS